MSKQQPPAPDSTVLMLLNNNADICRHASQGSTSPLENYTCAKAMLIKEGQDEKKVEAAFNFVEHGYGEGWSYKNQDNYAY